MSARGARPAALDALLAVSLRGRLLDDALEAALDGVDDRRERALARELAFGACRFAPRLEAVRDHLLARPLKARDRDVGLAVVLGLFQLEYTRVAAHAAVSETVALVRAGPKPWAAGLVNALLRRFVRERTQCLAAVDRDPCARLAHPRWLLDALREAWPEHWQEIARANNDRPPMSLRVNARRGDRAAALAALSAAGVDAAALSHSPEGLVLATPRDVADVPGFADGRLSVQDEAAQLAAHLLAARPGHRLLDACAAPGGKLAHALELCPGLADAVAVERDPRRIERLRATLARLGLAATVVCADASDPGSWWDGTPFDRILLDAPCSATGVVRRHPDIKLRRDAADVERVTRVQRRLLDALWPLLARGGRLLYATCSVMPAENAELCESFVQAHADARVEPLPADWGLASGPGRQILPGHAGMDGFYYALLAKV